MPRTDLGLPPEETAYLEKLSTILRFGLGEDLVGIYLFGSAALDAYEPGFSDLDVQVVVSDRLGTTDMPGIAHQLLHETFPCPAQKLELVIYRSEDAANLGNAPRFLLNLNTGKTIKDKIGTDPSEESPHWFLLDIAQGRVHGKTLYGPPPSAVFEEPGHETISNALDQSLSWHTQHERGSANDILNLCRALLWRETGNWASKRAAGEWHLSQRDDEAPFLDQIRRALKSREPVEDELPLPPHPPIIL